ncbi:MAG: DUF1553 domain-containing protein [Planctomycetota bacterium]|nr:DUF1553 domain-containing protein [Planctomycetota bacterium]
MKYGEITIRTATAILLCVGFISTADAQSKPVSFVNDIQPLLSRAACNSGGCHGKQAGRNGFKLSLFAFDPEFDYQALATEARGRRVFPAAPQQSLLLAKAVNRIPHGGGQRFAEDSDAYRLIQQWIGQGAHRFVAGDIQLTGIAMSPAGRVLQPLEKQQVTVTARYSDGSTRDVTKLALYETNSDAAATVDEHGLVTTSGLGGEAAIMANYMGFVSVCRISVPMNATDEPLVELAKWDATNFIDRMVAEKWKNLKLAPSQLCDDSTFLRRAFLDCIGRLPSVAEAREFLADDSNHKRDTLISALLEREEYADYQAVRWADLLRVNSEELGARNAVLLDRWLRESFQANVPFDQFVRELMTAQGSTFTDLPTNFYKGFAQPNDKAIAVSQIFLGVRLECAQCHHHPYEKWGQDDFYGLAAFFPRLKFKAGKGGEQLLFASDRGDVKHPGTGLVMAPKVLGGASFDATDSGDRRTHLAEWMTQPDNPFVARTLVNRVWAQFMGRGLVDPVDDMRDTNPATNEELLDALARDFVLHKFDIKHVIRTITSSRVYSLSSEPNQWNVRDTENFSRAYRKRLSAEVLLDAVCDVTETIPTFDNTPPGTRALQLWNNRLPSSFLDVFGRPERKTVCECERTIDTSLAQVLHLMNAPPVNDRIQSPVGRAARLSASEASTDAIIADLYLAALNRTPRPTELKAARQAFDAPEATRRQATEDVLWALMNTAEFVLNH